MVLCPLFTCKAKSGRIRKVLVKLLGCSRAPKKPCTCSSFQLFGWITFRKENCLWDNFYLALISEAKNLVGGFKVNLQVEKRFGLFQSFTRVLLASCWVFVMPGLPWFWFCALPDHDPCQMWPMVMFLLNCTQCALVNLRTLCFHPRCRRTDDTWPSIKLVWHEQMIPDLAQGLSLQS